MFDIRNIQNLTQICLRYLLYITEFSVVWYHLSCHASPTFGRYSQWCVCDCTYPSSFPAWQEIKIHRRYIFPRGGIEGIRRREGKDRDNGRQRERGKSGESRIERKERRDLLSDSSSKSDVLVFLFAIFNAVLLLIIIIKSPIFSHPLKLSLTDNIIALIDEDFSLFLSLRI